MAAAIAGFVLSHVGTALTYVCCLGTNVDDLTDAAKDLEGVQADLQVRVDEANRNGEQILNQVEDWIEKASRAQVDEREIVNQIPGIFNLKSRYTMSKRAKETAESMNDLRDRCNFVCVSSHSLPASMGQLTPLLRPTPGIESRNIITAMRDEEIAPLRPTSGIESRKNIEEDIIKALTDEKVYVIGICGMGGVGKTTMAKQIMHRAKENEHIFDEVLLVVVGQQAELLKIQHDIADWLDLKLEAKTLGKGAIRLRARLQGGKRKLIIIDDVWEQINLEELGIPCQSVSSTIILTSRDSRVLRQMNAQRVFTIQILSEEEAWSMFQENVGACLDDNPLARDVAKECKGLPLALVVVSRALKDQAIKGIWKDALKQLQSSNPEDMKYVIAKVYNPIKLSYDFLESRRAKSLLFLCSSFPDDHEISLEYLEFYGFGLGIFEGINTLEEARNRIAGLVDMLKSRFLILDGKDKHYVKMHDVVRDVAIFIAKQEKHAILEFSSLDRSKQNPHINDCNMLSMFQNQSQFDFPTGLIFPNLSFLWMYCSGNVIEDYPMSDDFLEGMQQLKVLSITQFSIGLKPQTMRLLKNLRTLHLRDCFMGTLSAVGELSSLEILCCDHCPFIMELPEEIGRLHCLRVLEVTNCFSLTTIRQGVISRLVQLEELKMLGGLKNLWGSDEIEKKGSNASLAELQSLSKLTCLEIEIEDWSVDAQVLQLSSKIVKFDIQVGNKLDFPLMRKSSTHEKKLSVCLQMCPILVNWIDVFASTAEYLFLKGVDYNSYDISGHQNIRCLVLIGCETVVKLASSASTHWGIGVFPVLEELYLNSLPKLEEICHGPILDGSKNQDVFLANLRTLRISCCGKLRRVFSSSVVIRSLSQLRILEIENCRSMEEVFWIEKDDGNSPSSCITFPKLMKLSLKRLENLTYFCKGIDIIEFPQLVSLKIVDCPKLTSFNNTCDQNHVSSLGGHESIHILCNPKISFGRLTTLDIGGYENISYLWCHNIPHLFFCQLEELELSNISYINNLFSYSSAKNLVNLIKLTIRSCDEMAYVVTEDDAAETSETKPQQIIFYKLEELTLHDLPKLQNFCEGRCDLQLPSLKQLNIKNSAQAYHDTSSDLDTLFRRSKMPWLGEEFGSKDPQASMPAGFSRLAQWVKDFDQKSKVNNNNSSPKVSRIQSQGIFASYLNNGGPQIDYLDSSSSATSVLSHNNSMSFNSQSILFRDATQDEDLGSNAPFGAEGDNHQLDMPMMPDPSLITKNMMGSTIDFSNEEGLLSSYENPKDAQPELSSSMVSQSFGVPDMAFNSIVSSINDGNNFMSSGAWVAPQIPRMRTYTMITFDKLTHLDMKGNLGDGDHIKHLFSYSVAGNLVNLKTLYISHYKEMVYVIADDEDIAKRSEERPQTIFRKLHRVELNFLPKLQGLCDWAWDVQFPSLKVLNIIDCPGMEDVTPEAVESRKPVIFIEFLQESEVDKTLITGAVDLSKLHSEVPSTFPGLRILQEDPIPIPIPIPPAEESLALVPLNQNSNRKSPATTF